MAKELLKLLDKVKADLQELNLPSESFTLSALIYSHSDAKGVTRTGQIRFALTDVLDAMATVNRRINKIRKLEKRITVLEKRLKK